MKIGLFGGAFNPVHNGHLNLANSYLDELKLDKILFIPTSVPPHKTADFLASGEDRINMLRLAIKNNPCFEMTDIEFKRQGKSYSYDTICELKKIYPNDEMYLIVGSDQFFSFHSWYRSNDILDMVSVVTAAREKEEYQALLDFKSKHVNMKTCIVANINVVKVSSSEIRDKIIKGESIDNLLPAQVGNYIRDKRLYV